MSHYTFSPQKGTPGHCFVAQVWDDEGNAVAGFEATEDPAIASSRAEALADALNGSAPVAPAGDKPATSEPVATLHDDGYWTAKKTEAGRLLDQSLRNAGSRVDVYTAPPDVPPGWVLVPVEPTHAMLKAAVPEEVSIVYGASAMADARAHYTAMLAAAPKAPT